jgi:hypothetical protein
VSNRLEDEAMTKKASKLDLRPAYGVTVIVLIALAVLVWIGTTPLYSFLTASALSSEAFREVWWRPIELLVTSTACRWLLRNDANRP